MDVSIDDVLLRLAFLGKHLEVRELFKHRRDELDMTYSAEDGSTAVIQTVQGAREKKGSIIDDHRKTLYALVENGANLDAQDNQGRTVLHWAILYKNEAMIKELIALGADAEKEDTEGHTVTQFAIRHNRLECVKFLLDKYPRKIIDLPNSHGTTALIYAVRLGNYEACELLLKLGADPDAQEHLKSGRTGLHYAIYNEQKEIFKLLIRAGARADIPDCHRKCVIHKAAYIPDVFYLQSIMSSLSDSMTSMEAENADGATPLMLACQREEIEHVKELLKNEASVTALDNTGKGLLHYCVENESTNVAEMVLNIDKSLVDNKDSEGYSALQLAVIASNIPMIKFLLKNGASIKSVDGEGHNVVHWATVCGHVDLIDLLESEGAALSSPDTHKAFPLHYAAQMCGTTGEGTDPKVGLKMLNKLLSKKCNVDCNDQDLRTPLLWAASSGSSEACEVLLKGGANVESSDKDGLTALHCAASRGHSKCIEVLVKKGAHMDCTDKNGCTPLFYAVTLGHVDCAKVLLNKKSHPSHQDKKGRSPAHCAAAKGSIECLQLLKDKKGELWLPNLKGECPIHEASLAKQNDTVQWLLQQPQDAKKYSDLGNQDERTPIHIAALTNNLQLCKILLDNGAKINPLMLNKGVKLTPYDAALLKEHNEVAEYLRIKGAKEATKVSEELVGEQPEMIEKEKHKAEKPEEELLEGPPAEENTTKEESVEEEKDKSDKEDEDKEEQGGSQEITQKEDTEEPAEKAEVKDAKCKEENQDPANPAKDQEHVSLGAEEPEERVLKKDVESEAKTSDETPDNQPENVLDEEPEQTELINKKEEEQSPQTSRKEDLIKPNPPEEVGESSAQQDTNNEENREPPEPSMDDDLPPKSVEENIYTPSNQEEGSETEEESGEAKSADEHENEEPSQEVGEKEQSQSPSEDSEEATPSVTEEDKGEKINEKPIHNGEDDVPAVVTAAAVANVTAGDKQTKVTQKKKDSKEKKEEKKIQVKKNNDPKNQKKGEAKAATEKKKKMLQQEKPKENEKKPTKETKKSNTPSVSKGEETSEKKEKPKGGHKEISKVEKNDPEPHLQKESAAGPSRVKDEPVTPAKQVQGGDKQSGINPPPKKPNAKEEKASTTKKINSEGQKSAKKEDSSKVKKQNGENEKRYLKEPKKVANKPNESALDSGKKTVTDIPQNGSREANEKDEGKLVNVKKIDKPKDSVQKVLPEKKTKQAKPSDSEETKTERDKLPSQKTSEKKMPQEKAPATTSNDNDQDKKKTGKVQNKPEVPRQITAKESKGNNKETKPKVPKKTLSKEEVPKQITEKESKGNGKETKVKSLEKTPSKKEATKRVTTKDSKNNEKETKPKSPNKTHNKVEQLYTKSSDSIDSQIEEKEKEPEKNISVPKKITQPTSKSIKNENQKIVDKEKTAEPQQVISKEKGKDNQKQKRQGSPPKLKTDRDNSKPLTENTTPGPSADQQEIKQDNSVKKSKGPNASTAATASNGISPPFSPIEKTSMPNKSPKKEREKLKKKETEKLVKENKEVHVQNKEKEKHIEVLQKNNRGQEEEEDKKETREDKKIRHKSKKEITKNKHITSNAQEKFNAIGKEQFQNDADREKLLQDPEEPTPEQQPRNKKKRKSADRRNSASRRKLPPESQSDSETEQTTPVKMATRKRSPLPPSLSDKQKSAKEDPNATDPDDWEDFSEPDIDNEEVKPTKSANSLKHPKSKAFENKKVQRKGAKPIAWTNPHQDTDHREPKSATVRKPVNHQSTKPRQPKWADHVTHDESESEYSDDSEEPPERPFTTGRRTIQRDISPRRKADREARPMTVAVADRNRNHEYPKRKLAYGMTPTVSNLRRSKTQPLIESRRQKKRAERKQKKKREQNAKTYGLSREKTEVDSRPVTHKGRPKGKVKVRKMHCRNYIQEFVRIFETKKLATQQIHRNKRLQINNMYRGGMSEKGLVKKMTGEYNSKARYKQQANDDEFDDVQTWEQYLHETIHQADEDEKILKKKKDLVEVFDPNDPKGDKDTDKGDSSKQAPLWTDGFIRSTTNDDSNAQGKTSDQRKKDLQAAKEYEHRRKLKEEEYNRKVRDAYKPMLPFELQQDLNAIKMQQKQGTSNESYHSDRASSPHGSNTSLLPKISPEPVQHMAKKNRSYSDRPNGSSTPNSRLVNGNVHNGESGSGGRTGPPPLFTKPNKGTPRGSERSEENTAYGDNLQDYYTPKYDGGLRPRYPLMYVEPELYDTERENIKEIRKQDFLRHLLDNKSSSGITSRFTLSDISHHQSGTNGTDTSRSCERQSPNTTTTTLPSIV